MLSLPERVRGHLAAVLGQSGPVLEQSRAPWRLPSLAFYVGVGAVLATLFHLSLLTKAKCCDAAAYMSSGQSVAREGVLANWPQSDLRTYFYPWFLSWSHEIATFLGVDPAGLTFLAQLLLHLAACCVLYRVLRHRSPRAAGIVAPLLLCNPLLLAYVPYSLTESLTVSVCVLWIAVVLRLAEPGSLGLSLLLAAAASLLAGIALMIRPANLVLSVATLVVVLVVLVPPLVRQRAVRSLLLVGVVMACAVSLPLLPQLKINSEHHGTMSPFPAAELGDFQLRTGIVMIKYVTDQRVPVARGIPYENPFLGSEGAAAVPADPLDYYWTQPWDGARLLLLHVFNALNPDFLFTYVHDATPPYRVPLVVATQALVFAGVTTLFALLLAALRGGTSRTGALAVPVTLLSVVLLNLGLNSVVAVETRFGILSVVSFSVALGFLPPLWRSWSRRTCVVWALAGTAWVGYALWLTSWVLRQAPLLNGGPA